MSLVVSAQGQWAPGRALRAAIAREIDHGRFPLLLPALAIVGIWLCVAGHLPMAPVPLGACALTLFGVRLAAGRLPLTAPLAPLALALAAIAAGATSLAVQNSRVGTPMLMRTTSANLTGIIRAVDRMEKRQRIVLALTGADLRAPWPKAVRLVVRGADPLAVGMTVSAGARLFPLRGPAMPGGYDPARRLYFDGIGATGFTYGKPTLLAPPEDGLFNRIAAVRDTIASRIMAADVPGAAFAVALLVGERGFMTDDNVEALRASGLGHVLAISGLHMALVAGSVFAAVRLGLALVPGLALRFPIRKWAAVAGLLAATIYLALSGGAVPTVRAYIMLLLALLAVIADRPALTMRAVAIAATLLIAVDPISALEPGFQMSFTAVVALVGAYEWWRSRGRRRSRVWSQPVLAFMLGLAATSLIAGLATLPAGVFHFHRMAPLGLVANLAAMPLLSLIAMPAGVVTLVAMPLGLEHLPLVVMGHTLDAIAMIAQTVARWSGDRGAVGALPAPAAVLMIGGLLWLAVLTAPWRLLGTAAIAAGLMVAAAGQPATLFVADDGRSIAVRGDGGTMALGPKTSSFAGEMMLRANADSRSPKAAVDALCDGTGCTLRFAGGLVAVPRSPLAAMEDCRRAAVVVSRDRLTHCPAALVIDRRRLAREGSLAAWKTGAGWTVRAERPGGPTLPWHVPSEVQRN
ncbi:ComEC/Rec2 family competence protein [Acuticoccus sp. MNP-M23]|uniref:ComEC/Rec2 family competence protein n=1 Tax=Acuticoccus sp. MNP-M23 TaxID=3072793 RepID=UPI0028167B2D|nr:ComEC/Rec2 family competence protein [Acuticoccus sp. MNP-M23]WMS41191.1 ComEC/Rec2 family competence protein [Acuticoccus sp. MNP-M23]